MARIRTIKPEFWASEQVMELSVSARLTFIGLWNFCDDRGVHAASTKRLKAEVFPSDDITSGGVADFVAELIQHGLVGEFEADGQRYWYVTGWSKHQRIEKPTYRHPTPPDSPLTRGATTEDSPTDQGTLPEDSTTPRRILAEPSTPEGNGMEGKGMEKDIGAAAPESDAEKPAARKTPAEAKARTSGLGIHELVAEGVNQQHAEDWLKVRKAKRMPLTTTAWESTKSEAAKSGITPAEAVRIAAERGWSGFMADYLKSTNAPPGRRNSTDPHFEGIAQKFAKYDGPTVSLL